MKGTLSDSKTILLHFQYLKKYIFAALKSQTGGDGESQVSTKKNQESAKVSWSSFRNLFRFKKKIEGFFCNRIFIG